MIKTFLSLGLVTLGMLSFLDCDPAVGFYVQSHGWTNLLMYLGLASSLHINRLRSITGVNHDQRYVQQVPTANR